MTPGGSKDYPDLYGPSYGMAPRLQKTTGCSRDLSLCVGPNSRLQHKPQEQLDHSLRHNPKQQVGLVDILALGGHNSHSDQDGSGSSMTPRYYRITGCSLDPVLHMAFGGNMGHGLQQRPQLQYNYGPRRGSQKQSRSTVSCRNSFQR